MTRQFTLSIAFVPGCILVSLTKIGEGTLPLQSGRKFAADGSIITLAPNQAIHVALGGDFNNDGDVNGANFLAFKRLGYIEQENIYKLAAHSASRPLTLTPGKTASLELVATTYGRGTIVLSKNGNLQLNNKVPDFKECSRIFLGNSRNAQVTVRLIEKAGGQIDGVLIALLLP